MGPNFTACAAQFTDNLSLYKNYTYNGTTPRTNGPNPILLTLEGCYDLCGTGNSYYEWPQASGTILTWVMPMLAMLVKAPFGAGSPFKKTMFMLFRWIGSPISSLAYIYWNIHVSGKAAMMSDMASSYDEVPGPSTDFADVRDSLFILMVMNQYSTRTGLPSVEAEKLVRVALFSDTLKLSSVEGAETLPMKRGKLAYRLRAGRRQGLVPTFIATAWWFFGLSISLENAFGHVGANATAHNLAIGLMLAWFPVVILCSVVDRTPWATDEIRVRLNDLLDAVRGALLDKELRETYMRRENRALRDFEWVEALKSHSFKGFFTGFAGQGRLKFHYGIANPILTGIEEAYVAQRGRGWLGNTPDELWQARTSLVLGPERGDRLEGLKYFDPRQLWGLFCAVLTVGGPVIGAFVISYFTPTVGYGCRSGGYTIFFMIAFSETLFEAMVWWLLPEATPAYLRDDLGPESKSFLFSFFQRVRVAYKYDPRWIFDIILLRPMEIVNTCWLIYIVVAQTFGIYNNCYCQASTWGGGGGYISFESAEFFKDHGVTLFWILGTCLSVAFMVSGITFVIAEWLTQSHINTTNYAAASRGLRRTRTFKKYTLWIRTPVDLTLDGIRTIWEAARGSGNGHRGRRSLVWSWRNTARSATLFNSAAMYEAADSFVSVRDEKGDLAQREFDRKLESRSSNRERKGRETVTSVTRTHSGLFSAQAWQGDALDTDDARWKE